MSESKVPATRARRPVWVPSWRRPVSAATVALLFGGGVPISAAPPGANGNLHARLDQAAARVESRVREWRRDIHQNPELSNREFRTAALVAKHLEALGFDQVTTGVAHTGVVGLLRGGRPGPVVALRADMDALPVTEAVDLPFASKVRTVYQGQEVGVMHACGHDAHTAILMGVAEVLAELRAELPGSVKLIFQPAEEGAPEGEEGGARLMMAEGALEQPKPAAIFALHTGAFEGGALGYRSGGAMAAADSLRITVEGRQTHGAAPHLGVDPITAAGQILVALQTIPSRQLDAGSPVVISIGSIHGGVRGNIIPERVEMTGTIRTLDPAVRLDVLERVRHTAEATASAAGATALVETTSYAPVTYNDPALTKRSLPSLERVVGGAALLEMAPVLGAEDFSFFQQEVPGFYFFLGVNRPGVSSGEAAPNHSPEFFVNEHTLIVGVRALASLAVDYLLAEKR